MEPARIKTDDYVWVDVRTPSEYRQGHVHGAYNLPLFTDEERAEVGTIYARQGKNTAIERGLELVGPRLADMLRQGKDLSKKGRLMLYCWRGGMRSASVAWLLRLQDMDVQTYPGGYRGYRSAFNGLLEQDWKLAVLGGPTLCGKTEILKRLAEAGEQVLDLEGMAHHKGSAFGGLGQEPQPTNETFSNELHYRMEGFTPERPVWCEDESLNMGKVVMPRGFYDRLVASPIIWVERPEEVRIERGMVEYGCMPAQQLVECFEKLRKRIGGDVANKGIADIGNGNLRQAMRTALRYYDNAYLFSLEKRPGKIAYRCKEQHTEAICTEVLQFVRQEIESKIA